MDKRTAIRQIKDHLNQIDAILQEARDNPGGTPRWAQTLMLRQTMYHAELGRLSGRQVLVRTGRQPAATEPARSG